jgi:glycosyltransferase involved in cell wall biosynthesis
MKVLHLCTSDASGGAARAANRLHLGLQTIGIASSMLVGHKITQDPTVTVLDHGMVGASLRLTQKLDRAPRHLYPRRQFTVWSLNWLPNLLRRQIARLAPDIINLHWVGHGFLPILDLRGIHTPLVWTMHDMWTFTGGCHYDDGCGRYTSRCGACPQLGSTRTHDLSRLLWQLRRWAVARRPITYVCPSHWLATCARASALLQQARIEEIPYGLDTMLFQPMSRLAARQALNLPSDRRIILFGAMDATKDTRKGYQFLLPALQQLPQHTQQPWLGVTFGGAATNPPDQAIPMQHLGLVTDDHRMRQVYAAADVFVAPSVQDNLPNTILEALSCGTPCVAFAIGGMPDMIEHQANGYLALPFDVSSLAAGIAWTVTDETRMAQLSAAARHTVESRYTLTRQAQRYHALYQDILSQSSSAI